MKSFRNALIQSHFTLFGWLLKLLLVSLNKKLTLDVFVSFYLIKKIQNEIKYRKARKMKHINDEKTFELGSKI